jgi:hypothetical protein
MCRLRHDLGIELCVSFNLVWSCSSHSVVSRHIQRVSRCSDIIVESPFFFHHRQFFSSCVESKGVSVLFQTWKTVYLVELPLINELSIHAKVRVLRWGHFSPLAAYDVASDSFLVMDVEAASGFHGKFWVTCDVLHAAMVGSVADGSGRSRGWVQASIPSGP